MADTVTTRIKLPSHVHADVKAEAARNGINLDKALGLCVTYLGNMVQPLSWRNDQDEAEAEIRHVLDSGVGRYDKWP
jgi:hypothetical protein